MIAQNYEFEALGEAFFLEEEYEVKFMGRTFTRARVVLLPEWFRTERTEDIDEYSVRIIYDE